MDEIHHYNNTMVVSPGSRRSSETELRLHEPISPMSFPNSDQNYVEVDDEETADSEQPEEEPKNEATESDAIGCIHYKRKCQLVCPNPKCDKVYTCRICHDEVEDHILDRYNVKEVVCLLCQKRQPVSNSCIKCSAVFGKYYCRVCNLFMDVYKNTFHCDGCGLCRVGPKENFYHCDKCAMCMPLSLGEGKHRCIEKSSRRDCPVCLEDIHTSRSSSHVPPCGHLLHYQCFNQMMHKALYACPICNQSMVEMSQVWKYLDEQIAASPPLPVEFSNNVHILCRDCHQLSTVSFHFVGLKCAHCGGYNTCIERGSAINMEAFQANAQLLASNDLQEVVEESDEDENEEFDDGMEDEDSEPENHYDLEDDDHVPPNPSEETQSIGIDRTTQYELDILVSDQSSLESDEIGDIVGRE